MNRIVRNVGMVILGMALGSAILVLTFFIASVIANKEVRAETGESKVVKNTKFNQTYLLERMRLNQLQFEKEFTELQNGK